MNKPDNPGKAPEAFYDPTLCPIRNVLAAITNKWSMLVITHLKFGEHRFSELKRALPDISQRMLTLTLRNQERDGLIVRKVTPTKPPRVDYRLSDLGVSMLKPLYALSGWAAEHRDDIERSRGRFDKRHGL